MRNHTTIIKSRTVILKQDSERLSVDLDDIERRLRLLENQAVEDEKLANQVRNGMPWLQCVSPPSGTRSPEIFLGETLYLPWPLRNELF